MVPLMFFRTRGLCGPLFHPAGGGYLAHAAGAHGGPGPTFSINQSAGTAINLAVASSSGTPVRVDWGDGALDLVASGGTVTHTYSANYSGPVRVTSGSPIVSFYSSVGAWNLALSDLPRSLVSFTSTGSNTVSGSLSDLPSGLTSFVCSGSNTISGTLSSLPSGLTSFYCAGSNTITGNLSALPAGIVSFYCTGSNTIADYSGKTWASNQQRVYLSPVSPGGLSSAEVDQLLIDLNAAGGTWGGSLDVYLMGTNAARTAASAAAVTGLTGKGVTVTTN